MIEPEAPAIVLGTDIVKLMLRHDPQVARKGLVGAVAVYLSQSGIAEGDLDGCLERLIEDIRFGFAEARGSAH